MLRITTTIEESSLTGFKLDGQIISDWVTVLEEECLKVLRKNGKIVIDASGVIFIDCKGIELFKRLAGENFKVENCSPLILELLDECSKPERD